MREFDFFSPGTVAETLELLNQYQDSCAMISGGTDIMIEIQERERNDKVVINISKLDELRYVKEEGGFLRIGATNSFSKLEEDPLIKSRYKALYDAVSHVGSPMIRNLGTIGGNVVSASVAGDTPTTLMAYDAELVLTSKSGKRVMKIDEFNVRKGSRRCQINEDELLTEIRIKQPTADEAVAYVKFGKRKALAIVVLACSIYVKRTNDNKIKDARVVLGAVGLYPQRSEKLERALIGKKLEMGELETVLPLFTEVIDAAIGNRPSVVYKREGVRGLAKICFADLIEQFALK